MTSARKKSFVGILVAIPTVLMLSGCPTYKVNSLPQSQPLAHAVSINVRSDYTHEPSHLLFPTSVANFSRVALTQYDTNGLDISAGYNNTEMGCLTALTIYVAPAPKMTMIGAAPDAVKSLESGWLNGAYNQWKREVAAGHPDAVLKSENEGTQDGRVVKKAAYVMGNLNSTLDVSIVQHAWVLTYRITYPSLCADLSKAMVSAFFERWGGSVAGS